MDDAGGRISLPVERSASMEFNFDTKQHNAIHDLKNSDQPLMVIAIRGQLIIEEVVNTLVAEVFSGIPKFDARKMIYATKINLLGGLRIIQPSLTTSLLQLNSLRNDFSHDPYFELSRRRVRKLIGTMPEGVREIILRDFADRGTRGALSDVVYGCFLGVAASLTKHRDSQSFMKAVDMWTTEQQAKFGVPPEHPTDRKLKDQVETDRSARYARGEY